MVDRLTASIAATVVELVFSPPLLPQIEDMPPGGVETYNQLNVLEEFTLQRRLQTDSLEGKKLKVSFK